jgi:prepilin-type processing-associated H-X9-DG protein
MALSECLIARPCTYNAQTSGDITACVAGTVTPPTSNQASTRGQSWFVAEWGANWGFSTLFPPNDPLHARYECYSSSAGGHFGARSEHPGGVNVCLGDGAVRFVSNNLDLTTWRAVSTVSANETFEPF